MSDNLVHRFSCGFGFGFLDYRFRIKGSDQTSDISIFKLMDISQRILGCLVDLPELHDQKLKPL